MGTFVGGEEKELPVNAPGEYYCRVTDDNETRVYSEIAVVTGSLTIIDQPQNRNLYGKESVTLYCEAAGGEPFDNGTYTYAWYNSADEQISFSDQGALKVTEPGEYYCVAEDSRLGHAESQKATVYVAEPLQCVSATDTLYFVEPEPNEIFAGFRGGVQPYTAEWKLDGEVIPTSSEIADGVYFFYRTIASNFGMYTCTVTDAMGNVTEGEVWVEYAQLAIAQPPEGGMLPQDGSGVPIEVVMAEGKEPFSYTLYHAGVLEAYGEDTGMSGRFQVYEPGYYFIHIEDADFRWATTEPVYVGDYEFHIDALTVTGPLTGPEDIQTLMAEVVGGEEPITYRWWHKGAYNVEDYTDTKEPSHDIRLPGEYYCEAEDNTGNVAISPSVKVEYTGDAPIITLQPQDVLLPSSESGEVSAELSCLAVSGSPTTAYHTPISYTWERKGESGWQYNREQGPTITVTEPGIYRCICRDTYSGQATISREVTVQTELTGKVIEAWASTTMSRRLVFSVYGGIAPYTVKIYSHRIIMQDFETGKEYGDVLEDTVVLEKPGKSYAMVDTSYYYLYKNPNGEYQTQQGRSDYFIVITDANGKEYTSEMYLR